MWSSLEQYVIIYSLKVTIFCKAQDSTLISRELDYLILEILFGFYLLAFGTFCEMIII